MITHSLNPAEGRLNISVPGDILSTNAESLRTDIFGVLESAPIKASPWSLMKIDLTLAKMVDSAGLNLLVAVVKAVKSRGGKVGVTIGSQNIKRTFSFTRLDQQIEVTTV